MTKVGKRGWTDMVNAVAPPIAAHEIIQVTLSHDMIGYDGISDVTYQVLAKVLEQVDSSGTEQQLVVNKAQIETPASKPKTDGTAEQERDLNAVEGFPAAFRLAKVNLEECIKQHEVAAPPQRSADAAALPITTCPVFVRIQACLADLSGDEGSAEGGESNKNLFFLVLLRDPQHGLSHKTVSQAVPTSWRKFLPLLRPSKISFPSAIANIPSHFFLMLSKLTNSALHRNSGCTIPRQSVGRRVSGRRALERAHHCGSGLCSGSYVWSYKVFQRGAGGAGERIDGG